MNDRIKPRRTNFTHEQPEAKTQPILNKTMHVVTGLESGGAERILSQLVMETMPAMPVVSLIPGGAYRAQLEKAGVAVVDLGMSRGRLRFVGILKLALLIRRHRPTILQTWMYHADLVGLIAWLLSGCWRSTALVWGVRSSNMIDDTGSRSLPWIIRICARLSRLPRCVVANSVSGKEYHQSYGYNPPRFEVIANGIDTERFRPRPEAHSNLRNLARAPDDLRLVIHIGRVAPKKDHATLREAAKQLEDAVIVAIGDGTEELPQLPTFIGLGHRDDTELLLAGADLAVSSSSHGEGFCNAIAEAMATGLPVVATDVGDAALIIADTGRLVPPKDSETLASAVREMLERNASERLQLGKRARLRIEKEFNISAMLDRFESVYGKILGEG